MNATQIKYAVTKAAHDTAKEAFYAELKKYDYLLDDIDNDDMFNAHCDAEERLSKKYDMEKHRDDLHAAELELVTWAMDTVSKSDAAEKFGLSKFAEMRDQLIEAMWNPTWREKLLDLSLRLDTRLDEVTV